MDVHNIITSNRDQLMKDMLKAHNKTQDDLANDLEILRNWFGTQKHLPEIPSKIQNFYQRHYLSFVTGLERVKF